MPPSNPGPEQSLIRWSTEDSAAQPWQLQALNKCTSCLSFPTKQKHLKRQVTAMLTPHTAFFGLFCFTFFLFSFKAHFADRWSHDATAAPHRNSHPVSQQLEAAPDEQEQPPPRHPSTLQVPSTTPSPPQGQPEEHGGKEHLGQPVGLALLAPTRCFPALWGSSGFCLDFCLIFFFHFTLEKPWKFPSLPEFRSDAFELLLLFFNKLRLSKMAGYLRENDTNLCESKWYNCNIHFHLESIFKVVMETNMAWMGNIWQANPRRDAQH